MRLFCGSQSEYPWEDATGTGVRTNVFVRDMDLAQHDHAWQTAGSGGGWAPFGGSQLAIHTTMVSPLHMDGSARRGATTKNGKPTQRAHVPEFGGEGGRARLVVLAAEVGGFLCQLAWAKVRELPEDLQRDGRRAWLK